MKGIRKGKYVDARVIPEQILAQLGLSKLACEGINGFSSADRISRSYNYIGTVTE